MPSNQADCVFYARSSHHTPLGGYLEMTITSCALPSFPASLSSFPRLSQLAELVRLIESVNNGQIQSEGIVN